MGNIGYDYWIQVDGERVKTIHSCPKKTKINAEDAKNVFDPTA